MPTPGERAASYRAPPADAMLVADLDAFTAVFHRASGITHLLATPAPEILAALGTDALSIDDLLARLRAGFDMASDPLDAAPDDGAALRARVDELVVAGLLTRS